MQIRQAKTEDAASIAKVHVDSWRTTYKGIVSEKYLASLSYQDRENFWRERLSASDNSCFVLVAEDGENIIGFAAGGPEGSGDTNFSGELSAIYLLENYQSKGIGSQLFKAVAMRLLQIGIKTMMVWVLAENPSKRFYESLGGEQIYEKVITIDEVELKEVAYGWKDISLV